MLYPRGTVKGGIFKTCLEDLVPLLLFFRMLRNLDCCQVILLVYCAESKLGLI